jgi:hypothetical protein
MRITLFLCIHFVLFLALRCITRERSMEYTGLSRRWRCHVQPEADMACSVGDADVFYGRRKRCFELPGTVISCMAI